jgi:F0F1-type ATP synthase membrane subunit b/b'
MINLDLTLILQLFIVLVSMIVLSQVVFKPFLGMIEGRKNWVEGAEKKAREFQQRTEELMEEYRNAISTAQAQGAGIREEIRKESLVKELEILKKSMEEANLLIGEMKRKIQDETQKARASLRVHAQNLSKEIAEKMLGRPLQ